MEERQLLLTFSVNSTADDGSTGTLRLGGRPGGRGHYSEHDQFQPGQRGDQTIGLTQGELELDNASASITIDGPGSTLLTINGNEASGVLHVYGGTTASISGVTISGGSAIYGGGVYDTGSTLTLTACTISGNYASFDGGGLQNYNGQLTLTDCTISGNSTAKNGGGLVTYQSSSTTLTGCTISGNSASLEGGGLYNYSGGTTTLDACTVSANLAQNNSGLVNSGTLQIGDGNNLGTGALINNASLVFDGSGASTVANPIVGGGYITLAGGGTVALLGSQHLHGRHDPQSRHAPDRQRRQPRHRPGHRRRPPGLRPQ